MTNQQRIEDDNLRNSIHDYMPDEPTHRDDEIFMLQTLLLRLKFLSFLTLAFALFPLGVGSGTILYSVHSMPGYLLAALVTGLMCLLQSITVILLVYEGQKISARNYTTCLFRYLVRLLVLPTLCTLLTILTYIAISGILGIIECVMYSPNFYHPLQRCGPHRTFIICLSMINLAIGCVLLVLVTYMSNIIYRKFVKLGLTSKAVSGQVYIRLNHIYSPRLTADV